MQQNSCQPLRFSENGGMDGYPGKNREIDLPARSHPSDLV
jgi:hypothetical protein